MVIDAAHLQEVHHPAWCSSLGWSAGGLCKSEVAKNTPVATGKMS